MLVLGSFSKRSITGLHSGPIITQIKQLFKEPKALLGLPQILARALKYSYHLVALEISQPIKASSKKIINFEIKIWLFNLLFLNKLGYIERFLALGTGSSHFNRIFSHFRANKSLSLQVPIEATSFLHKKDHESVKVFF